MIKFLTFTIFDVSKVEQVAKAADKVWSSPPKGIKIEANYTCLANPFPGIPPNTIVGVTISEAESAEAIATTSYPLMLAGVTIHRVPILEIPVGDSAKAEKKLSDQT
jgi:hypothetical protein